MSTDVTSGSATTVWDVPGSVRIHEVGPRDGLQSHDEWVDTSAKVAMIDLLSTLGFPVIEVSSFAHPRAVPFLRDAEEVFSRIARRPGTQYRALVPNAFGARRAAQSGADSMLGLVTVSEKYNQRNQNRTVAESIEEALCAHEISISAGLPFTMAVGMALFCPFEGVIPVERTLAVIAPLAAAGVESLYVAGSIGMENPRQVAGLVNAIVSEWPNLDVGFHIHDYAGFGAANAFSAIAAGATFLESSICGLGGGLHAPSGASNIATEDLVHVLNESGVHTGIATAKTIEVSREIGRLLGVTPRSRAISCGTKEQVLERQAHLVHP